MRELHNDLLSKSSSGFPDAYDKNEKVITCDTALRALLHPNVK